MQRLPDLEPLANYWYQMAEQERNTVLDAYERDGGYGSREQVKEKIEALVEGKRLPHEWASYAELAGRTGGQTV
jgi:hypothetical protein